MHRGGQRRVSQPVVLAAQADEKGGDRDFCDAWFLITYFICVLSESYSLNHQKSVVYVQKALVLK